MILDTINKITKRFRELSVRKAFQYTVGVVTIFGVGISIWQVFDGITLLFYLLAVAASISSVYLYQKYTKSRNRLKRISQIDEYRNRHSAYRSNSISISLENQTDDFNMDMSMEYNKKGFNPNSEPMEKITFPLGSDNPSNQVDIDAFNSDGEELRTITEEDTPRQKIYTIFLSEPVDYLEGFDITISAYWPGFFSSKSEDYYYRVNSPLEELYISISFPKNVEPKSVRCYELLEEEEMIPQNLDDVQPNVERRENGDVIRWHRQNPTRLRTYLITWENSHI